MLTKKLRDLSSIFEEMQEKVNHVFKEFNKVKESLANRNKFRSQEHFCRAVDNSGPACHCHYFAFGKVDPNEMLP